MAGYLIWATTQGGGHQSDGKQYAEKCQKLPLINNIPPTTLTALFGQTKCAFFNQIPYFNQKYVFF